MSTRMNEISAPWSAPTNSRRAAPGSAARGHLRVIVEEVDQHLGAAVEGVEGLVLVRRVGASVRLGEPGRDHRRSQLADEVCADGDRPARADEDRLLAPGLLESRRAGPGRRMVAPEQNRLRELPDRPHLDLGAWSRQLLDAFAEALVDILR